MIPEKILVTGATGSFGRAFCAAALAEPGVKAIYALAGRWQTLDRLVLDLPDPRINKVHCDIGDVENLRLAFRCYPDAVVHAAAVKDVRSCEQHPSEAKRVNVDGTENVLQRSLEAGVKRVVFISTDKAVAPANYYGKTKGLAEATVVDWNAKAAHPSIPTRFAAVRYGNVMGSSGSVIPRWREALARGEVLEIRHPAATRFWIEMRGAVALVMRALEDMTGGEIFVPRLPSTTIDDLRLALAPDAPFRVLGQLQPGEKLHEVLISAEESARTVERSDVYVVSPPYRSWAGCEPFGRPVALGWEYSSVTNPWRLTVEELRALLGGAV